MVTGLNRTERGSSGKVSYARHAEEDRRVQTPKFETEIILRQLWRTYVLENPPFIFSRAAESSVVLEVGRSRSLVRSTVLINGNASLAVSTMELTVCDTVGTPV